jgi:hypothetical protein
MIATVGTWKEAQKLIANGLRFGGYRHSVTLYWETGPDSVCPRCSGVGHTSYKACGDRPPRCYICAGDHEGLEHACKVTSCQKLGAPCLHLPASCANCGGNHQALNKACPQLREARKRWKTQKDQALRSKARQPYIPEGQPMAVVVSPRKTRNQGITILQSQWANPPNPPYTASEDPEAMEGLETTENLGTTTTAVIATGSPETATGSPKTATGSPETATESPEASEDRLTPVLC